MKKDLILIIALICIMAVIDPPHFLHNIDHVWWQRVSKCPEAIVATNTQFATDVHGIYSRCSMVSMLPQKAVIKKVFIVISQSPVSAVTSPVILCSSKTDSATDVSVVSALVLDFV